jgi:hypothetical protein
MSLLDADEEKEMQLFDRQGAGKIYISIDSFQVSAASHG